VEAGREKGIEMTEWRFSDRVLPLSQRLQILRDYHATQEMEAQFTDDDQEESK
jgi:hypothetical protein